MELMFKREPLRRVSKVLESLHRHTEQPLFSRTLGHPEQLLGPRHQGACEPPLAFWPLSSNCALG